MTPCKTCERLRAWIVEKRAEDWQAHSKTWGYDWHSNQDAVAEAKRLWDEETARILEGVE
jgi:hypothetical protein